MLDDTELRVAALCANVLKDHMRWIEAHDIAAEDSEIGRHDNELTVMLMSELVVNPVKCALDSLYVACTSLRDLKYVRGAGHPTLIRSAITSATTSLWMLDDDPVTRRTRALKIAFSQCKSELTYIRDAVHNSSSPQATKDAIVNTLNARRDGVIADAERLGVNDQIKDKGPDSDIVRLGADHIPSTVLGGCQTGFMVVAEWRLLSGLAHGLHWPARHATEPQPTNDDRYLAVEVAFPARRLLYSLQIAMTATRIAMDRYAALAAVGVVTARKPWELRYDTPY
ncbi:hypothetical protein [Mycobacteroides abscessus]|uniref:hypothetical protein n=1 Tax=Mycobacteroides abscessus TaxID=36809 RepID=UPI000929B657|nr:hypothetical protein [Mycobacteroides abscessus]RIT61604.1 hypothetical protein D2E90_16670 [Mycobacteroides abscessus]SIJ98760.1 Uncharacterised protein [Mycobacteroides abscessus subsp. abscessus]